MSDGTLSVRRRQPKSSEISGSASFRPGGFESFLGGVLPEIGKGSVKSKVKAKTRDPTEEFRVESRRTKRLKEYDRLLKGFKHAAALDSVLRQVRLQCMCSISTVENLIRESRQSLLSRSLKN
jgi:U3 small nucleolar RNA-associated protein 15